MNIPLTPIRCLYSAVDRYGSKVGIVCGQNRYTYADFGERCERLAAGFLAEGVERGDRIACLSFNTHQLFECYYAAPMIRAIVMPLNVRLTSQELIKILNHAGARILIYESDFAALIPEFREFCPGVECYVEVGQAFEDLMERGRLARPDIFSFDEEEIAELFYTSGSTGCPKGVALSHRTIYLHALNLCASIRQRDTGVELHTIPMFHANGWGRPQTSTMMGMRQVMVRRFDPENVLKLIQAESATSMSLVPVMANALLNCPNLARYDVSSMEDIWLGGAASSPELIERMEKVFHCNVMVGYGLTETSPVVSCAREKATITHKDDAARIKYKACAGIPILGAELRVVDAHMRDVPRDMQTVGEVIVRGDMVMECYYSEPQATAEAIEGGWFHTGDMAVWNEELCIDIVDRKKDIIISGGENISSIEIERAIFAHPAVLECAVVSAPDAKWGEIPIAIIVLKPKFELTEEELRAFIGQRLARFKLPKRFDFVEGPLPKTGTGKIFKRGLRETFWTGKVKRVQGA